jgi:hypothetical protein
MGDLYRRPNLRGTALATSISSFHSCSVKSPFYVVVIFIPISQGYLSSAASHKTTFVCPACDRIEKLVLDAGFKGGPECRRDFMKRIGDMQKPYMRGLRQEIHFTQAPTDL